MTQANLDRLRIDRSNSRSPRRSGGLGRLLLILLLLAVVAVAYLFRKRLQQWVDRLSLPKIQVMRVEKSHPAVLGAVEGMAANGYIVAARRAALSADAPGRIVDIRVREGMVVKKGELIARLYDQELKAAVLRAEADLKVSKANLTRSRARVSSVRSQILQLESSLAASQAALRASQAESKLAQQANRRNEQLIKKGVITQTVIDQSRSALRRTAAQVTRSQALIDAAKAAIVSARSQVQVAQTEVSVAEAQLTVSQANLQQAQATLQKTEIRAPFTGIVVLKDAERGEVVSPNVQGGSSSRGSVATMVDFESLEVQADVPETNLSAVSIGAPVQIFLDAYPEDAYQGQVDRIWPTANRQKATVEVRVRFLKKDERLRPEMSVRVVFSSQKPRKVVNKSQAEILVPEDSIVRVNDADGVFVLERDTVQVRPVKLGARRSGRVVILEGLQEGQQLVLKPPSTLNSGDRVQLEAKP